MSEKACQSFAERLSILKDSMEGMRKSTIQEFAQIVGVTRPTMSYYLSGQREPDASTVRQICQKCNVSADWLLGLSDVRTLDANARAAADYTGLSAEAVEELHGHTYPASYPPEHKEILSKLILRGNFMRAMRGAYMASRCMNKADSYIQSLVGPIWVEKELFDASFDPKSGTITLNPIDAARYYTKGAEEEFGEAVLNIMPEVEEDG